MAKRKATNGNGVGEATGYRNRIIEYGVKPADQFLANPKNARMHPQFQRDVMKAALTEVGFVAPVIESKSGVLLDGHERIWQAMQNDNAPVPFVVVDVDESEEDYVLATFDPITSLANYDAKLLDDLLQAVNSDHPAVQEMLAKLAEDAGLYGDGMGGFAAPDNATARPTLSDRFIVPPFSVLDARQGYWQERKQRWIALGLKGELGRGNQNLNMSHPETTSTIDFYSQKRKLETELGRELTKDETAAILRGRGSLSDARTSNAARMKNGKSPARTFGQDLMRGEHTVGETSIPAGLAYGEIRNFDGADRTLTGTSIMDPVLCELAYRWFCPHDGLVINPTAGEATYGIVAGVLGLTYQGVEIRAEQIESNREQAIELGVSDRVHWVQGDGQDVYTLIENDADFIMCCPPYFDLEIYSDDPQDLSNAQTYDEFLSVYRGIVAESCRRLKPDRFACFVVGDIRDKQGHYRNFVSDTIQAFLDAGLALYNEAILVTAAGSLPIRAGKQFSSGRKLGKTHQNVLVFVKGDWRKAVAACGEVEVTLPDASEFSSV